MRPACLVPTPCDFANHHVEHRNAFQGSNLQCDSRAVLPRFRHPNRRIPRRNRIATDASDNTMARTKTKQEARLAGPAGLRTPSQCRSGWRRGLDGLMAGAAPALRRLGVRYRLFRRHSRVELHEVEVHLRRAVRTTKATEGARR